MKKTVSMVALPLFVGGCAATLPADVTPTRSPALPYETSRLHHHNPIGAYTHRVPVEPRPWRQQNDAQTPGGDQ
jgi:hypothetical protein